MNPYQSPGASEARFSQSLMTVATSWSISTRVTLNVILLLVGVLVYLALNGQTFTNALVCLALIGVSGLVWLPLALSDMSQNRFARYAILVHVVLMAAVAINLPANFTFQKKFNAKINEFRARSLK